MYFSENIKSTMLLLLAFALFTPCQFSISGIKVSPNCSQPLGMEDGRISDSQITASSSYQETLVGASKARLNSESGGGAWCPRSVISSQDEPKEYLEINLLVDHVITSVVIQGRFANGLGQEYTEYYILQFWREGMADFDEYREGEEGPLLRANTNTYQAVEQVLQGSPVIASKVRIVPFSNHPRTVCLRAEVKGCRYAGRFSDLLSNKKSLDSSGSKSTFPQKDLQVDDWGESMFLGAAVGILVTVFLAAISAIILVLVRNRRQKKSLSELSRYTNMTTGTSSSIQSSLTSHGHLVDKHQPDVIQSEKTEIIYPPGTVHSEEIDNYAPSVGVRCEQNSDKDSLILDMVNMQEQMDADQLSDVSGTEYKPSHLSLPYLSHSTRSTSPPKFSSKPNTFVHSKVTSGLPHKTTLIKSNWKIRPPLPALD